VNWLWLVAAYLLGSIPSASIFSGLKGKKITETGSGNVGAKNTLQNVGVLAGIATALVDLGKGAAAVWLARRFGSDLFAAWAAVAAIAGHNYMLFLRFQGGKGLATGAGAFLLLSPASVFWALGILAVAALILRDSNVGAAVAAAAFPFVLARIEGAGPWFWVGLAAAIHGGEQQAVLPHPSQGRLQVVRKIHFPQPHAQSSHGERVTLG